MKTALITLSDEGARLLVPLIGRLPEARLFVHESVPWPPVLPGTGHGESERRASRGSDPERPAPEPGGMIGPASAPVDVPVKAQPAANPQTAAAPAAERFTKIAALTAALFPVCRGLVYAAPCGAVVRALAPLVKSKYEDPAVVVLDVGGRWAVSLLAGHEGGANELAIRVANLTGAEPVITTTTEALKSVIVGIGCRRGTPAERIVAAIRDALAETGVALDEVRLLASADIKADEPGIREAAETLGVPLRFLSAAEIRTSPREFSYSDFVEEKVNLPAVAEPAALLAGRRTRFICRKRTYKGITISLAREGFPWSESAPANH